MRNTNAIKEQRVTNKKIKTESNKDEKLRERGRETRNDSCHHPE